MLEKLGAPLEALSPSPAGLLCLPFEIRLQIYRYCIPQRNMINVSMPRFDLVRSFEGRDLFLDSEDTTSSQGASLDVENDVENDVVNEEDYQIDWEWPTRFVNDAQELDEGTTNFEGSGSRPELSAYYWNDNSNRTSIFRLSKQISEEALDILYGENMFKVCLNGGGELGLSNNFTQANRQRMRHLLLIAEPCGINYWPGEMPNDEIWSSILPKSKTLRIVARQPTEALYPIALTLEKKMDEWIEWFKHRLQCFAQHLSRETIVKVDIDGRTETGELLKECLPYGYQEIRCHLVGDLIFKRGHFSWQSGYWDFDDPINSHDVDDDWNSD
jgi:hypothetical protein